MTMLDAIDDGGELALHPAVHAGAEDLCKVVLHPEKTKIVYCKVP
jgi:hypothetical protein